MAKVVRAVTTEPQSTRAWKIGAEGEEKLAAVLAKAEGVRALLDRRVPGTRGNIDHIVVAPAGVFVVDAKHLQGRIEIRNRGWLLRPDHRLYVGRRDRSDLARNMTWQVEAIRRSLREAAVEPLPTIIPVLCFIDGDWPTFGAPDEFEGVRLEGPRSLVKLMTRAEVLDRPTIDRLWAVLAPALPPR